MGTCMCKPKPLPLLIGICAAIGSFTVTATGQNLKTGAEFDKASNDPISQTLAGLPIRQALKGISEQYSVCIFLDRRVDPAIRLKQNPVDLPLKLALFLITEDHELGLVQFGSVWYIGPLESAAAMEHRYIAFKEKFQFLDVAAQKRWNKLSSLQWQRLTVPSELVEKLVSENGLTGQGIEKIPFDIWHEKKLPGMKVSQQLFLLLYGFELMPRLTAADGAFVIEECEPIENISLATSRSIPSELLATIKDKYPGVDIERKGSTRTFTGKPIDVYKALWSTQIIEKVGSDPSSKSVFTLNTTAQRGAILKSAATQLDVQLQFDPSLNVILQARVTINVTRVSPDELIKQVLSGTGCSYQLSQSHLKIFKN